MTRMVALLRGINVGGNRKVPMARLRKLAIDLGYTDVATYIASGNLLITRVIHLLTPDGLSRSTVAAELGRGGKQSPLQNGTARNWATVVRLLELLEQ